MSKKENQTRNPKQKKEEKPDWKTRLKTRTDKGKTEKWVWFKPDQGCAVPGRHRPGRYIGIPLLGCM
jgi:hypothetical protein